MLLFIFVDQSSNAEDSKNNSLASAAAAGETVDPLDTLSSSEIAATAAQLAALPEAPAIINQADTDQAQLSMVAAGNSVITKPQVVESDYFSNKDIKTYVVKSGDTLASVAKKFGLNEDTLKWSNDLTSTTLKKGQKLLIPPVNGIVYTVKKGDTISSLADKYSASKAELIAYNDAELKGIKTGERIIIPGGKKPTPQIDYYGGYGGGFAWGSSAIYGRNGYAFGECTWYVATQIPVPANWGNAATWAYYAQQTPGWQVSSVPTVGSIAQNSYSFYGYGHVAIVVAVKGDQVKIRDMNGIAGWDRVGEAWRPASNFNHYISR